MNIEEKFSGFVDQSLTAEARTNLLSKLELCVDKMNAIHGRVDVLIEKLFGEGGGDLRTEPGNSIEGIIKQLLDMSNYLYSKVVSIDDKL